MTRDLIITGALAVTCLWYGWAKVEDRAGQMAIAALGALALVALLYL